MDGTSEESVQWTVGNDPNPCLDSSTDQARTITSDRCIAFDQVERHFDDAEVVLITASVPCAGQ
jgi:hypothetical protein